VSLRSIARRYAAALFDVADRNGTVDRVDRQLAAFSAFLDDQPELRRVFDTPAVAAQKKRAILDAVLAATDEIDGETRQLLRMLADRDRLSLVSAIAAAFVDRVRQARHVLPAEVVTAVPLGDAQRASLTTALRAATGSELTVTERVDPAILGGVVARVGSLVFDGSVARQLERMKQRLLQEQ
jgi:F-type H+-transporting ATPase subunit delta